MHVNDPSESSPRAAGRRPLLWWPVILFTLTTALLLVANRVSAWYPSDRDDAGAFQRHAERMLDRILDEVDASEEQAAAIRSIGGEIAELVAATRAEGEGEADALRAALAADPLDRAALEAIRRAHLERADTVSEAIAAHLADALEVLTREQRQQLLDRADEFRREHGDHHGHFGARLHRGHRGPENGA